MPEEDRISEESVEESIVDLDSDEDNATVNAPKSTISRSESRMGAY